MLLNNSNLNESKSRDKSSILWDNGIFLFINFITDVSKFEISTFNESTNS